MKNCLTRTYPTIGLCAAMTVLTACKEDGPPLDLLSLTMTENIGDVVDTDHDTLLPGTDTVINPGTLNIKVSPTHRFEIAGIPLPPPQELDGPSLRFLLYSQDVLAALGERMEAGVGGGEFRTFEMLTEGDLDSQVIALGADPQIIGLTVSYTGEAPFFDDVQAALTARLGPSTGMAHLDRGIFWEDAGRYILITPDYSSIRILAASQVVEGCLLLGPPGVVDVGGCNYEAFFAALPNSIRTAPTKP